MRYVLKLKLLLFFSMQSIIVSAEDLYALDLESLTAIKISGATSRNETGLETPAAYTLFERSQIQRLGLQYLHELMAYVPSFQAYLQGAQANHINFSSRARRIGNSGAAEILILIDGQRIAESGNDGSANILPLIPLGMIERVEFIRGPGSAIYGSNAMMGVVNIISRKQNNEVSIAGNDNHQHLQALGHLEYLDTDLNIYLRTEDRQGQTYSPPHTTAATSDPQQNIDFLSELHRGNHTAGLRYTRRDAQDFYVFDSIDNASNASTSQLEQYYYRYARESDTWDQHANISYTKTQLLIDLSIPPAIGTTRNNNLEGSDTELKLSSQRRWQDHAKLLFGLNYRRSTLERAEFSGATLPTLSLVDPDDRNVQGLFANYQYQFQQTHLHIGGRIDKYDHRAEHFSPRIAMINYLSPKQTIKIIYGEAFRFPSFAEAGLMNNPSVIGNPQLKPETSKNWDLIWQANFANSALSVGYYETHFEDSISQTLTANQQTLMYINEAIEPAKGIELEALLKLSSNFDVRFTASKAIESPNSSFREADDLASLIANYQYQRINVNWSTSYTSARDIIYLNNGTLERRELSPFVLHNLKLKYGVNQHSTLSLVALNLFDKAYFTPNQSTNLPRGVINQGRNIFVEYEWEF